MRQIQLGDVALEVEEVGAGEPLLLIHGGALDTFFSEPAELPISSSYRLISYHRRGYGGSSPATAPFPIAEQAGDARALLRQRGISRAHVAGHSYGGAIAIQLALDHPDLVGSLALLEPGLPFGPVFLVELLGDELPSLLSMYQKGDRTGALGAFFAAMAGPEYRTLLEKWVSPGTFERAVADIETGFGVELAALQEWGCRPDHLKGIQQPVLSVVGEDSMPAAHEVHELLTRLVPHAEGLAIPQTNHLLPIMSPHAVAAGLAGFLGRQRL
jgi:3-oxoadipate enol-lactonase